jgi:hypothetical protein
MFLITKAYHRRQDARLAIEMADFERARQLALEAQALCSTREGADLQLLSSWLLSVPSPPIIDPVP